MHQARRRQRPIDAARRCHKTTIRASPQQAGKTISAAAKQDINKTSRPAHHPLPGVVTRDKPGQPKIDATQHSEIVILQRRGRGPKASKVPRSKSMPRDQAREIGGRPQVWVEDGPPQRVAMGMSPRRVPAARETEGGGGSKQQQRRQRLETF